MTLHVLFTKDGIPGWIGAAPREGSEPVEGLTIEFMAGHRRRANGTWVARAKPPAPTPEEREAERLRQQEQRRAERQEARRAARDAARRERLFDRLVDAVAKIDPDLAKAAADLDVEFKDTGE